MTETGQLAIHAENILPIIKKWLYAEKDIFLRELVANACDALTKLSKLSLLGEVSTEVGEARVDIKLNKDAKTISITDTGIGMTADEIKKYIAQVAFSGVQDFVEKYEGKGEDQQIIGHFGLGFYSAYMVAHKVEIDTLSYKEGSLAARWVCDGSIQYELGPSERTTVGTTLTLHVAEDSLEMLEEQTIRSILGKHCAFVRYPVYLEGKQVNETQPAWTKSPSALEDKDYLDLFHNLFPGAQDPLFWVHVNLDYPFRLSGVLYFPKLRHELDASNGEVKLFCNQVYVAENCKELVPQYLTLLKGVIDCPDLPLNVSRSSLQNDPTVRKISSHITKKVADRLSGMFKTDRTEYEKFWDDIHPFVKFGMMRDNAFYERMKDALIYKTSNQTYTTLDEYLERNKDKTDGKIIYTSDESSQASYVAMFREQGLEAVLTSTVIDLHFIPFLEMQTQRKYKFERVDASVADLLVDKGSTSSLINPKDNKSDAEKLDELFRTHLQKEGVKIRIEGLRSSEVPAMLVFDENVRRLQEMSKYGAFGDFGGFGKSEQTLLVNLNSAAVKRLLSLSRTIGRDEEVRLMINHIYDLAYLQQGAFSAEDMLSFIRRSSALLGRVGGSGLEL